MLNSWKAYLFNNFQNLQRIEDFGLLYEKFISEFPEFRKQWGVYYTPEYIVEYIVKNTVGKIIENKTPQEISKIKILDPSCGSGSFLLGAYQYLLDYHLKYYHNELKMASGSASLGMAPHRRRDSRCRTMPPRSRRAPT